MRKKFYAIISLLLILPLVLAGCGNSVEDVSKANVDIADSPSESAISQQPELKEDANLSRAEWAWMISKQFGYSEGEEEQQQFYSDVQPSDDYYSEIQLCKAFDVFTEEETFEPDTLVNWNYAIESAVRAIGIEKLQLSEGELVNYYTQNIADVSKNNMDDAVTVADAALILNYAYDYNAEVELPQEYSFQYNESVYEVSLDDITIKGDGETAVLNNNKTYNVGDILCTVENDNGVAYAIKITEINAKEVKYIPVGFDDVYKEFHLSGTYIPTVINVEAADDITVSLASDKPNHWEACSLSTNLSVREEAENVGLKITENSIVYNYNKGDLSFEATLSNIKPTVDIDYFILIKKVDAQLSFDTSVNVKYKNNEYESETIPLGYIDVPVFTGVFVRASLYINIGATGEATLDYSSKVVADVGYKIGAGLRSSVDCKNAQCEFNAQCTVTAEPTAKLDIRLGFSEVSESAANAKISTGIVAVAKTEVDLLEKDQLACTDIYAYVPLRWAINEDGCILTAISKKLKVSNTVWDSESSPCQWSFHWENGTLVDACTRGDKVETPPVDEEGEPYDEYKLFDFEEIDFGVITVASQTIYLKNGESMKIGITSVPDGYSADKLVYSPDNASVCSISGGRVTALSSGASTVKISTDDGKYSVFITIVVEAEYNDTSGFQPL